MRVLVTGANGYLGRGVVEALLNKGVNVIATDRLIDRIDTRAIRIQADIFTVENPYDYFYKPDILLHMAWRDGFEHYSESHIEDLFKHFTFIKTLLENGVSQFIGMGSMHEIGFFEGSIDESTPCNPITPYGIGKNTLRELTELLCNQKNIIFQWLRGFYIVSNDSIGNSIFSKIIQATQKNQLTFPFTLGQNQYDFIDYDVFCEQVSQVVIQKKVQGIINICSGYPEKLSDRVERFIKENNLNIVLEYGKFPDRPYDSKALWGNNEKINYILKNQIMRDNSEEE